jgi:hypothetical protein
MIVASSVESLPSFSRYGTKTLLTPVREGDANSIFEHEHEDEDEDEDENDYGSK